MSVLEIPAFQYHADIVDERPSLSSSVIKELVEKTPAHARAVHPKLNPNVVLEDKLEFDIGTVAHALLLEGHAAVEIIEADDWRTKAAKEARDLARSHGRIPLLDRHWQEVQAMSAALREQFDRVNDTPGLFVAGKPEQTLVWEEQDVLCRARLDWLHDDHRTIDDYKTSSNARPEKWSRSMLDYGFDIQAAFYRRAVLAVFGEDAYFRFAVVEKSAPYALTVFSPAPDVLELANRKIDYALGLWRSCLASGEWPAYPSRVCWVNLPPWAETQWYERTFREEGVAA